MQTTRAGKLSMALSIISSDILFAIYR